MARTYNNLYLDTRLRLRHAGIEQAQLEARELICCASGKNRNGFFQDLQLYASTPIEERLESLVQRRLAGEPVAYILGEWEFYGMNLEINRNVLIPRSDTECVAQRAIQIARGSGEHARVLDLCTGSGCIGLSIAKHAPNCRVVLADLSDDALELARHNAARCQLQRQITCFTADALSKPPELIWDFNLIVCNPPYIRSSDISSLEISVRDYEPKLALDGGADGLEFYRSVASKWRPAMRSTCILLFEVGYDQADDVEDILSRNGFRNIKRHQDSHGIWRAVEGSVS